MRDQILQKAINRVDFDRELVFKFFVLFSMFEYALKEAGFSKSRKQDQGVSPDWKRFANVIYPHFNANLSTDLQTAVSYYLNNPPMKQVIRQKNLWFEAVSRNHENDTEWLSVLIRQVRNNLFHGGKANYKYDRDTPLIHHAITILEAWAVLEPKVADAINHII